MVHWVRVDAMRHILAILLMVLGFGGGALIGLSSVASASGPHVALLTLDGPIDVVNAKFLARGIDTATEEGAVLLIVLLDTPGGLLDSTQDMVEEILAADIPIVVYVSPPGAFAASAGTFLLAAAHLAAMAPSTNVGAASPVSGTGEDLPETLAAKTTQNAAASLRSIAEERGRNAEALEQTVLSAASYSASEALDLNIIDIIAEDVDDLLVQVDGRTAELRSGDVVIETRDLEIREIGKNPVERFLSVIAHPNIALLLLSLGSVGIMVELFNPGLLVPGILGAIALALAFVAVGNLPVNWVGVGLLFFGMLLFYLEMQAPGIGIFGIGGGISFVLGAFLLFGGFSPPPIPAPSSRVSIWAIVGIAVPMFASLIFFSRLVYASRHATTRTTAERVVGQLGVVTSDLDPRGTVQVAGEPWTAVTEGDIVITANETVRVVGIEGVIVKVSKAE